MAPLINSVPNAYRRWRFEYNFGMGYEFKRSWLGSFTLEVMYRRTFGSIIRDITYQNVTYPIDVNVRYLSLMLGYRIPLGKAPQKAAPPAGEYYAPQ